MTREDVVNEAKKRGVKIIEETECTMKLEFEHQARAEYFHWKMVKNGIRSMWPGKELLYLAFD